MMGMIHIHIQIYHGISTFETMVACETKCVPKGFEALCESASKTQEKKSRKQQRQSRAGVPTIGIVGYTNAGTRNARGEDVANWMEDASERFLLGKWWPYPLVN